MRDLVVSVAFLALIWLAFTNTFISLLIWGWTGLISIQSYTYGFMKEIPVVQLFAVLTLLLLIFKKDHEKAQFEFNSTLILFSLLALQAVLSATFAYPDVYRNWELCTNLLKTLLFCALMPMLLTSRFRVHAFTVMIVLGVAFHGMIDGLKFISSGGGHIARGIVKYGDNNHFALILTMTMPLTFYLYLYSEKKLIKIAFLGILFLNVLAVVATQSRGGLICLVALATWMILRSRRKLAGMVVMIASAGMVLALAPDSWSDRMSTINSAEQDSSFMSRVAAWKKSTAIALENPLLGGGFHAVQAPSLVEQFNHKQGLLGFIDTPPPYKYAAHSIYFEVMGDMGFVGLAILLAILFNAYILFKKMNSRTRIQAVDTRWASDLTTLALASIFVFVIGGGLLSAAYFELPYIILMLIAVAKSVSDREIGSHSVEGNILKQRVY